MLITIGIMFLTWILGNAQYPGTTKEWDFMTETGQDNADVNGGIGLNKGSTNALFAGKVWREPVVTALGWGFEGDEVACMGPNANINMGDTFSTHMWIYVYDFTSKQTVWG